MSVKQVTAYECDLCARNKTAPGTEWPKGWIQVSLDGFLDRTWIEKAICDSCLEEIDKARKRVKS
mgnify:CR=1